MDILQKPGSEWRTILYEDARAILKKSRERVESISRDELEDLVDLSPPAASRKRRRQTVEGSNLSDMDDDNDVMIVENNSQTNNTSTKRSPVCFLFH